jgi:hypothetical protein
MKDYEFSVSRHDISMMVSGAMLLTAIKAPGIKTRIFFGVVGVASFLGDTIKVSPSVQARWRKNTDKFMEEHLPPLYEMHKESESKREHDFEFEKENKPDTPE